MMSARTFAKRIATCGACGKGFVRRRTDQPGRYCSWACSGKAKAHALAPLTCEACKTTFQPKRPTRRFCSRQCCLSVIRTPEASRIGGLRSGAKRRAAMGVQQ